MKKIRNYLKFLPAFLLALLPFQMQAESSDRPNILFIMADDHALEAISAYGTYLKDYAKTPNIDRIAEEGMRFDNCFCNNSICSPSRATILSGQYSHKNGVTVLNGTINENAPWYPVELQKSGYQTCVVGKWHLESWPKGFDKYWITKKQGNYFDPTFYTAPDADPIMEKGYYADVYADYALNWLEKREDSKPFLLCLQLKGPHHPYDYPERTAELYKDVLIPEPENLHEDVSQTSPLLKALYWGQLDNERGYYFRHKDDVHPPMWPHDPDDHQSRVSAAYQHMMHKYIRCITAGDENVGRLLDYLDNQNLKENTIVVYTSDQGYWLGQHGFYDKRLILEESLKMPFLIRYPEQIEAGSVSKALIENVDFGPTFLDYAGVDIPDAMQGRSIAAICSGKKVKDWRSAIFYSYWATWPAHWGIRTDRYKYVRFPDTDEVELYDLKKDPSENENQALKPEYSKVLKECEQLLQNKIKEVDISQDELPKYISHIRKKH